MKGKRIVQENAYFTVEAALVFPIVLGTVIFVVYMLLFQYNRCLMEQDMGMLILWGSCVEATDGDELEEMIQARVEELYRDKYAAWKFTVLEAGMKGNRFSAEGNGELALPVLLPMFGWNDSQNPWSAEAKYEYNRLSRVEFIRLCNRLRKE